MSRGLEIRGLHLGYKGRADVLCDLSLDAPAGVLSFLLGPNASGKSSLIKAVLGLIESQGEIRLGGEDLRAMSGMQRAQSLAYVPQSTQLSAPLSVRQVVRMARYAHIEAQAASDLAVDQALADAGCESLALRSFLSLSGGQRAQVMVARALATGANTLLLDEPSAALDIGHTLELAQTLETLAGRGRTIIWAMHDLHLAYRIAQHCVLLHRGRVVAQGSPQEVLAPQRLKEVYGVELQSSGGPIFTRVSQGRHAG